jgi:hypothetical protein
MIIPLPWSLCSISISLCLITMIINSCASPPWSSFHVHAPSLCDLVATSPCHICCYAQLNSLNHNDISNLVSLITKTKLGLSGSPAIEELGLGPLELDPGCGGRRERSPPIPPIRRVRALYCGWWGAGVRNTSLALRVISNSKF